MGANGIADEMAEGGDPALALEMLEHAALCVDQDTFLFWHGCPDRSDFLLLNRNLNILVSAYRLSLSKGKRIKRHIALARRVFLDSGVISLLKAAAKGKVTAADIQAWTSQQRQLVDAAWQLYSLGVQDGVVAMMDHPCEPFLLRNIGMTPDDAVDITCRNASAWLSGGYELPPGWMPCYVAQGWLLSQYENCLDRFEDLGVLNEVDAGRAWLAAGSTCMRRPVMKNGPGLYDVYEYIRSRVGGHIHALGVSRVEWIRELYINGWINTADSATASIATAFNRGPCCVMGKREDWQLPRQYAANMSLLEANIAAAIWGIRGT